MSNELAPIDTFTLWSSHGPGEAQTWLREYGYRCAPATAFGSTVMGLVFGRINEPAYLVMVGETLEWDGENVRVRP